MLPMSTPMIVVAAILQVTGIWNDFLFGLVFAGRDNLPMTVQLNNIVNTTPGERAYNVNMAATILTAARAARSSISSPAAGSCAASPPARSRDEIRTQAHAEWHVHRIDRPHHLTASPSATSTSATAPDGHRPHVARHRPGEFLVLLGPSGCGKSTLLNAIAGLLDIADGEIWIAGKNVTWAEPKDRGIGMVFQSYALYPRMSVEGNLSFGLRVAGLPKAEIDERVAAAAEILQIEPLLKRRPAELSGGQRQRVAIGRALVRDVDVFLFDEPLSNLDAKLRAELRVEIKRLHQELGNTMIYVTHDQIEAMTLADRIAVMNGGIIQQLGTPAEIYHQPVNRFVAGFIGSPAMNFFDGRWQPGDRPVRCAVDGVSVPLAPLCLPPPPQGPQPVVSASGRSTSRSARRTAAVTSPPRPRSTSSSRWAPTRSCGRALPASPSPSASMARPLIRDGETITFAFDPARASPVRRRPPAFASEPNTFEELSHGTLTTPISFQLYSARNFPARRRRWRLLADAGYSNVETFGPYYEDVEGFRQALDAAA